MNATAATAATAATSATHPRLPSAERQATLVAAALHLASRASPESITTSDLAAAVGVTQGAVFRHFASKEAVWLAALQWVRSHLLAALEVAAAAAPTPLAALEAVFHAHLDFVVAHPGVPRFIFHELQQPADSTLKHELRLLLQDYRKLLARLLRAAVAHRQVPAELQLDAAASLFVGIVQGLAMQSLLGGKPGTLRAQAPAVWSIYLRGIERT
jgi:AcrR family transcriptional regulator